MTPSGTSTPRSFCALSTAIHSRRSSTILCSGDQMSARSDPAYRVARTFGTVTRPSSQVAGDPRAGPEGEESDAVGDVRAPLGPGEGDGGDPFVGAAPGSGEVGPHGRHR